MDAQQIRTQIATARHHDIRRATALLGDTRDGAWRTVATITQGLETMAALQVDLDFDDMSDAAKVWAKRHDDYKRMQYHAEGAYAGALSSLLWAWSEQVRELAEAPDYVPAEWSGVGA